MFINVASFQPAKNQMRVVEVFHRIAQRQAEARLLLVGREVNGYQARVREAVERRGLADKVTFAGERADVPRLLKAADVLLFPSKWEGLPGAVLESCAAGLPVVASDIPGVLEIGRHFPGVHALPLSESDARVGGAGDGPRRRATRAPPPRFREHAVRARPRGRRAAFRLRASQLGHADCLVLVGRIAPERCWRSSCRGRWPLWQSSCCSCRRRSCRHLRAQRRPDAPAGVEPGVVADRRPAAL